FFASLKKRIGARNPVRIGSSCAAVTGYDFPLGQSLKFVAWASSPCFRPQDADATFKGEGGKKGKLVLSLLVRGENQRRLALCAISNQQKTINFFKSQEPEYLSGPPHSVVAAPLCRGVSGARRLSAVATTEKTSSHKEE